MKNTNLVMTLIAILFIAASFLYVFTHGISIKSGTVAPTDVSATNHTEVTASVGMQTPLFQLGGATAATSIQAVVSTGSCSSASSTAFAIANPFAATSTVTLQSVAGTGQATSTAFLIGTSTQSTGILQNNMTAVFASTTIATSSVFYYSPGTPGYAAAGGGNNRTIQVGPNEYIVGMATSTGYQPTSYTGGITCAYKFEWRN